MCATCGCSAESEHDHHHHDHHHHEPFQPASTALYQRLRPAVDPTERRRIDVEQALLQRNDEAAAHNRQELATRGVVALNLVSSPGAGKTTLLERTIRDLAARRTMLVIEGDQATSNDADRIRAAGATAVQINTGTGCHLDASMVARALRELDPPEGALLMIENVGNLVCPALFDLGERAKVLVASVTEGDDKPIKYPHMFRAARLVLLSKIDLLPYVPFDRARFEACVREVNPSARVLAISATRGDGLADWYAWLDAEGGTA